MKLSFVSKGLYFNRSYGLTLTGSRGSWTLVADRRSGFVFTGIDSMGSGKAAVSRTVVGIPSVDMAEALEQANVIVRGPEQQLLPLFEQEDGFSSVVLIPSQGWLELPLVDCLSHDSLRCTARRRRDTRTSQASDN